MKRISSVEAWRELLEKSNEQPFLLFKFSMTCVSSLSAKKELQSLETELPIYMVVVQMDRPVSNVIETDLGVKHESPQLLILKDGKGIWQATHYKIKKKLLQDAINTYI
ncbi:bacillithiol system redox-active protein YtxJ [Sporosarcina sp. G11-34]|uniref:bacillithiol system redox-active protein YtxJ n=1 Tax=Sporosarcina sp. G11-34 TaxID=2849605 RepID=UPI0022A9A1BC|nr:bacillithiol system redox-active protein YtxJ [Sporosarcina sp. G11-34]MCZ2260057.1 bacillithiol system redox-active protein YtxJ [Sporosarcina sp. G11-34]